MVEKWREKLEIIWYRFEEIEEDLNDLYNILKSDKLPISENDEKNLDKNDIKESLDKLSQIFTIAKNEIDDLQDEADHWSEK